MRHISAKVSENIRVFKAEKEKLTGIFRSDLLQYLKGKFRRALSKTFRDFYKCVQTVSFLFIYISNA